MNWKFLNTGYNTATFNMKLDEDLATCLKNGIGSPTLRVYGWNPPAISLGFNQSIEDFDTLKLRKSGIDIVRRPTGGRAILHAHELTYCVVMKLVDQGPRAIYRFINEGLLRGLQHLGISAQLTNQDSDFRKLYKEPTSIPCFSSSAKSEIHYQGRKLVGSAQRRYGSVILQHGSILLGPQHREIVDFITHNIQDSREVLEDHIFKRTIDIETILGKDITFEETAIAIKQGFEYQWNIHFEDSPSIESMMEEQSNILTSNHH